MIVKKFSLILSLIFLSIGLLGCQQSGNEEKLKPTIIGEIVQIEGGRFLVESIAEKLPDGRPDAIWFSTDNIESLKVGQNVSVWTTAVEDSYPQQANAEKIEINEK